MTHKTVSIPSLRDTADDFSELFRIYNQLKSESGSTVCFNFPDCKYLHPNAVAFIGGLTRLLESRNNSVEFEWNSLSNKTIRANLYNSGFAESFNHPSHRKSLYSIPYREDKVMVMNSIMDYLSDLWLGKGWVHVTTLVRNAIAGNVWEIYNNAFEHSGSKIGVFTCGQYLKNENSLLLSVVDFGQGIASKVRDFFSKKDSRVKKFTDARCLLLAFRPGITTSIGDVPRGLGLDLLKEFIQLNQGKLEVYCNNGYGIVSKEGKRFENHDGSFDGTIIHITLRCDESLYQFKNETNPLFL